MKKFYIPLILLALSITFLLGKQYSEKSGIFRAHTAFGELKIDNSKTIESSPDTLQNFMVNTLNQ